MSRRTVTAIFLVLVLCLALAVVSCGNGAAGGSETTGTTTATSQRPPTSGTTSSDNKKGEITAKTAMELLLPEARRWAPDAVPLALGAVAQGKTIVEGRCNSWSASFYSPSTKEVYVFNYYQDEYMTKPQIGRANKPLLQDLDMQPGDLLGSWAIDSPEAADIAKDQGLAELTWLEVSLRQLRPDVDPPQQVPTSCEVYWRAKSKDGKTLYLDAGTGEILGVE